jgi:Arc/MetJ-type ribon-helix-helix transcriptional regulator
MDSWRELRLPAELCEKIEEQIRGSQFATLEEFVTFLLREVTSRNSSRLDEQERQTIEQRLRDLGYM